MLTSIPLNQIQVGLVTAGLAVASGLSYRTPDAKPTGVQDVVGKGIGAVYDRKLLSVDYYRQMTIRGTEQVTPQPHAWFDSASDTLSEVVSEAQADDAVVPAPPVMQKAKAVLTLCASHPVAEPAIAHDDKGGIEILFKRNAKAIMVAVQADGYMTIYGDDPSEQWRGRYKASGVAWRRHLALYVAEVAAA